MTSHRVPPRHPDMPPIPQDGDGPVFREPWEAQGFAMVLELYDRGHFTWSEWVRHLSAEIASARARGEPDTGGTHYRHWLAALEKLVAARGLTSAEELAVRRDQWAEADHHRGFGEPIVLDHPHAPLRRPSSHAPPWALPGTTRPLHNLLTRTPMRPRSGRAP